MQKQRMYLQTESGQKFKYLAKETLILCWQRVKELSG
jgi:hypothetical protein